jgi:pSer/pThr/pTyr-binding forkhead associated (FHA) protein
MESEVIRKVRFVVRRDGQFFKEVEIDVQGECVIKIGNDQKAKLYLPFSELSRMHAVLEIGAKKVTLLDLGNEDGSRINGVKVNKGDVKTGDVLGFGSAEVAVTFNPSEETAQPNPADQGSGEVPAEQAQEDPAVTISRLRAENEGLRAKCKELIEERDAFKNALTTFLAAGMTHSKVLFKLFHETFGEAYREHFGQG